MRSIPLESLRRAAIVLMAVAALVWLSYETWRLLFQPDPMGAIDLKLRVVETRAWFDGHPVYGEISTSAYPPASYLLLWPLIGWMDVSASRWLWAATTVIALVWLIRLLIRETNASTTSERLFVALIPLSMYATGATIGNGQLMIHALPPLLAALILLRDKKGLLPDLAAAGLFVLVLVKPSSMAPFFWIILFATPRWRAPLLVVAGYGLLTVAASSFQEQGVLELMREWVHQAEAGVDYGARTGAYANQSSWLLRLDLEWASTSVALLMLAVAGVWTFLHRRIDIWLLLGVLAFVGRFWTYHRWYDDLLLLLPVISLYRVAWSETSAWVARYARILFVGMLLFLIAPGGLYLLSSPWREIYLSVQLTIWLLTLTFLLVISWRAR